MSVLTATALGLGLGLKHALEADHVAAVCTFVARGGTVGRAVQSGALWGLGHAVVLTLATGSLVLAGVSVPPRIETALDIAVAVMLVGLGIHALVTRPRVHDEPAPTPNRRPFAVGVVHGASGTAALTLLVASRMHTPGAALVFVGVFSFAAVIGMALAAALVALPLRSLARMSPALIPHVQTAMAFVSIAAGISIVV
jgi:nickel/cobalt transporter (NicO) family protein